MGCGIAVGPTPLSAATLHVRGALRGRKWPTPLNEQDTKATRIEPVLRALGWNLEDLDEVRREYKNRKSDKLVDYALLVMCAPKLFVEAKALDQDTT